MEGVGSSQLLARQQQCLNRRHVPQGRRLHPAITCRRTVKGKEGSRSTSGTAEKPKPPPPKATAGTQSTKPSKQGKKQVSPLAQFMRDTPVLNRFADGTLLLGDLVMIAATEVSSERIPYESMPMLTGVSLACWLVAAAALGDYKGDPPTTDNWYLGLLGPSFLAIIDSTVTWAVSVTLSLAIFSVLVQGPQPLLDSGPMLDDLATENLSPQLEVAVAALITMACWRGIAARLRHG